MPSELHIPIESANTDTSRPRVLVLERRLIDDIDERRDDRAIIAFDLVEQWLEPPSGRFNMRVEEDEHVATRFARPK